MAKAKKQKAPKVAKEVVRAMEGQEPSFEGWDEEITPLRGEVMNHVNWLRRAKSIKQLLAYVKAYMKACIICVV
jgi:hypothetical protein